MSTCLTEKPQSSNFRRGRLTFILWNGSLRKGIRTLGSFGINFAYVDPHTRNVSFHWFINANGKRYRQKVFVTKLPHATNICDCFPLSCHASYFLCNKTTFKNLSIHYFLNFSCGSAGIYQFCCCRSAAKLTL